MSDASQTHSGEVEVAVEIEQRHRQPDLCTIYETNIDEMQKMARWVTAKGDAFVNVRSCR